MYSFSKKEKLKSNKLIAKVFNAGKSIVIFPFKLYYLQLSNPSEKSILLAISVPKKNIKKAVKRNFIKRRIKEAYRLNKLPVTENLLAQNKNYAFLIVYLEKKEVDFHFIQEKIIQLLDRFITINEKNN
jgi:ribonuclease P protein component